MGQAPLTIESIIRQLELQPHPEGGFFRRSYSHNDTIKTGNQERHIASAIYFLVTRESYSRWHKTDADEIWHYYAGAPLEILHSPTYPATNPKREILGLDLPNNQRPQILVPGNHWQTASIISDLSDDCADWTLVGCTLAPAFRFEGFVLADS